MMGTSASDGMVVIDGQQRVTALAGALLHPEREPRGDIFAIWFDLEKETFERLEASEVPPSWIPLNTVADSFDLLRWLDAWKYRSERPDLVKKAIALGKAIREYQLPAYIVEGADEPVLRTIFKRINTSGVEMKESEVFQALYGTRKHSVRGACERLVNTGFGALSPDWFLRCLKAVNDIDPRATIDEREFGVDEDSINRTEHALRRAIVFLMEDVGIVHHQFLPYRFPLVVLSRFFHLYPTPSPRTCLFLRWWVWRGALTHSHTDSSHANVRAHLQELAGGEFESASAFLARVAQDWPNPDPLKEWYGRSADTRLCALAMLALRPINFSTHAPWTVTEIQERLSDDRSLGELFTDVGGRTRAPVAGRVAVVHQRSLRLLSIQTDEFLHSHGLSRAAVDAWVAGDYSKFDTLRARELHPRFEVFFQERAGYRESLRPSISDIVAWVGKTSANSGP